MLGDQEVSENMAKNSCATSALVSINVTGRKTSSRSSLPSA